VPGVRTNGASVPSLRALARLVPLARDAEGFEALCTVMDDLSRSGSREQQLVGSFIIGRHQAAVKDLAWSRVREWLAPIDNWETCDQLAAEVLATMVHADPRLARQILSLTKSANVWQRRLAVATAASVNQRGRAQPAVTTAVCDALERDPSPMIRRAVAWARRELDKNTRTRRG